MPPLLTPPGAGLPRLGVGDAGTGEPRGTAGPPRQGGDGLDRPRGLSMGTQRVGGGEANKWGWGGGQEGKRGQQGTTVGWRRGGGREGEQGGHVAGVKRQQAVKEGASRGAAERTEADTRPVNDEDCEACVKRG